MKHRHKHEGIYSIDFYAYASGMREWNSTFKVLFAICTLIMCVAANNIYVSCLCIVGMGYLTLYKGRVGIHHYLTLLTIPAAFMIMGSAAIAFGVSLQPIGQYNLSFHWFYLYTSGNGIRNALKVVLKAFGAVSAMYMLVLSTPASEIILVLRQMHVPKMVIELMNMIYRFIFIIMDVQCKMKNSAQSRLGYCDFKTSCYSFGNIARNLLIVSLKKANAYYDALISRGYQGELLFLREEKEVKKKHMVGAVSFLALLVAVWIFTK